MRRRRRVAGRRGVSCCGSWWRKKQGGVLQADTYCRYWSPILYLTYLTYSTPPFMSPPPGSQSRVIREGKSITLNVDPRQRHAFTMEYCGVRSRRANQRVPDLLASRSLYLIHARQATITCHTRTPPAVCLQYCPQPWRYPRPSPNHPTPPIN